MESHILSAAANLKSPNCLKHRHLFRICLSSIRTKTETVVGVAPCFCFFPAKWSVLWAGKTYRGRNVLRKSWMLPLMSSNNSVQIVVKFPRKRSFISWDHIAVEIGHKKNRWSEFLQLACLHWRHCTFIAGYPSFFLNYVMGWTIKYVLAREKNSMLQGFF